MIGGEERGEGGRSRVCSKQVGRGGGAGAGAGARSNKLAAEPHGTRSGIKRDFVSIGKKRGGSLRGWGGDSEVCRLVRECYSPGDVVSGLQSTYSIITVFFFSFALQRIRPPLSEPGTGVWGRHARRGQQLNQPTEVQGRAKFWIPRTRTRLVGGKRRLGWVKLSRSHQVS